MFVILLSLLSVISATHFTFDPTSRATTPENWQNGEVPCVGDHIRFDNTLPVVAFIDHNLNVESITLPDNGVVVFTDNGVDLGGNSHWQCAKEAGGGKDVFFTRDETQDTSFFNPTNWITDGEFFLDMNKVPSEDDDVTVSSLTSAQIYLDIPVVVNKFQWYKRERMTTDDFDELMRTMEGQFQLVLPRTYARESDQGGVQRMIAEGAVTVKNRNIHPIREGRVNGNSRNQTLSAICQYVKCPSELPCIATFVPFGHCCQVCGAKIWLAAWQMDFEAAKSKIKHVVDKMDVLSKVTVTAERKTMDELSSEYEIVIANRANETFDEDLFSLVSRRIIEKLAISLSTHNQKSILDFKIHVSKIDRTIKTVSKVVASFIYFAILIALVAGFTYRNLEVQVSRQKPLNPVIRYRRMNDDVAIELDDVNPNFEAVVEDVEASEDVANSEDLNPNFEAIEEDVDASEDAADSEDLNPNFEELPEDVEASEASDDVKDSRDLNPNFDSEDPEDGAICPTPPPGDIQLIDL